MKIQNQIQTRDAQLRADSVQEEDRTAVFVITSEDVDTYGTVFRASGWDFESYKRNPVVAYNHNALDGDPDQIIGTTEEIWQEGTLTYARVRFEDAETNPLAEKVFRKVKNGTLRMASINAYIDEASFGRSDQGEDPDVLYFTKQRLSEWSVVSLGSNPSALKRNEEALQEIRSAYVKKEDNASAEANKEKRASTFDVFEAQYMFNQNAK